MRSYRWRARRSAISPSPAIKNTQISVRQATGSNPEDDARITSKYHGIYTGLVSTSVSPGNRYFPDFAGAHGITKIVG